MPIHPPKVIICDNDNDTRRVIGVVLRLDGFEVRGAANADECIAYLQELNGDVNVVVIDGQLATDRSVTLIVNIKKINPATKILVIADRFLEESKVRVMDYGADEFTLKPITLDAIANKVTLLMSETVKKQEKY